MVSQYLLSSTHGLVYASGGFYRLININAPWEIPRKVGEFNDGWRVAILHIPRFHYFLITGT